MQNAIEQTNATQKLSTLPKRHSQEYVEWLVIEIGKLAIYVRDQKALDSAGIIQTQMAQDLADERTEPALMEQVFAAARKKFNFLPKTPELLEIYKQVSKDWIEAQQRIRQQAKWKQEDAERADRAAHPEKYVSLGEVLKDAGLAEDLMDVSKVRRRQANADRAIPAANVTPMTQPSANPEAAPCPYCGHMLIYTPSDIRFLSIDDLEAIIQRRKREKAERQDAIAKVLSNRSGEKSA